MLLYLTYNDGCNCVFVHNNASDCHRHVCVYVWNLCVAGSASSHATPNHYKSSGKLSSTAKPGSSSSRNASSSKLKDSLSAKDADDTDTDPSRVKTLCDSPDHISAKLNQRILSADHVPAPPSSVASSVASDDSNSSSNTTESAPLQTASHRPKTVKTLGSKMRSTGKQRRASCLAFMLGLTFHCDSVPTFLLVLRTLCVTDWWER